MTTKPTTTTTARTTAKNNMFISTHNNFPRESRYFVHIRAVVAPLRHKTTDAVPKKIPPTFAKLNEIEQDR